MYKISLNFGKVEKNKKQNKKKHVTKPLNWPTFYSASFLADNITDNRISPGEQYSFCVSMFLLLYLLLGPSLLKQCEPLPKNNGATYERNLINNDTQTTTFTETYFRPDREYHFVYDGQYSTGLPRQSSQYGTTRYTANVTLILLNAPRALLKIDHIKFGTMNGILQNQLELEPFEKFDLKNVSDEHMITFGYPVSFDYINGMISDIQFNSDDRPWFKNLKRGILSMLQINIRKKNRIEQNQYLYEETDECDPCRKIHKYKDFFASQEVLIWQKVLQDFHCKFTSFRQNNTYMLFNSLSRLLKRQYYQQITL